MMFLFWQQTFQSIGTFRKRNAFFSSSSSSFQCLQQFICPFSHIDSVNVLRSTTPKMVNDMNTPAVGFGPKRQRWQQNEYKSPWRTSVIWRKTRYARIRRRTTASDCRLEKCCKENRRKSVGPFEWKRHLNICEMSHVTGVTCQLSQPSLPLLSCRPSKNSISLCKSFGHWSRTMNKRKMNITNENEWTGKGVSLETNLKTIETKLHLIEFVIFIQIFTTETDAESSIKLTRI